MIRSLYASVFLLLCCAAPALAQVPGMPAPQKEHEWLHQFVGDWESEAEGTMGPGQPPMHCKGTMSAQMLGGFWLVSDTQNSVQGMDVKAIQTIGYDPESKKYVGTWVDSVMNHLWKYEGSVDETGKILTLEADGPNFISPGKITKFRDAYEFKSKDEILVTSSMQGDDGKWITFMTGTAKRKAAKK